MIKRKAETEKDINVSAKEKSANYESEGGSYNRDFYTCDSLQRVRMGQFRYTVWDPWMISAQIITLQVNRTFEHFHFQYLKFRRCSTYFWELGFLALTFCWGLHIAWTSYSVTRFSHRFLVSSVFKKKLF